MHCSLAGGHQSQEEPRLELGRSEETGTTSVPAASKSCRCVAAAVPAQRGDVQAKEIIFFSSADGFADEVAYQTGRALPPSRALAWERRAESFAWQRDERASM